ncbi:hypothetical protein AB0M02_24555 [Actinoplanes sp. NPDC051861]|uniref:hypothetical protein n=1 Tax=Actinoplanes sp. NPDC051861 TaxID=3155170 RepID=UPI003433726A
MVNAIASFGDRILSLVIPQSEVRADDTCTWKRRCKRCALYTGARWERQLCCTSQDGSYCNPWEDYTGCINLATC